MIKKGNKMKLKSVMLLPLMVASLYATTATKENVTKVYVADFDRAPDSAGLDYWVKTGLALEEISQSFFDQEETKEKYPDTLSTPDFVNTIYKNAFNREGDPDGITYWTKELEDNVTSRGNMILAVVNGAQDTEKYGNDLSTINNKTEVGLHFAESGLNDVEKAISVMDGITDDDTTVVKAKEAIDNESGDTNDTVGSSFELTTELDTIDGTADDDKITGTINVENNTSTGTYNDGDNIDGGAGTDTLTLDIKNDDNTTTFNVVVKNVEKVVFTANNVNFSIDATQWTGVQEYTIPNNVEANLTKIRDEFTTLNFKDDKNGTVNVFALDTNLFKGTDDTVVINSSKATDDANITATISYSTDKNITDNLIENYKVNATSNKGLTTFNLQSSKLKTVTVTGDSEVKLDANTTNVTSIDASGLSKKFTTDIDTTKDVVVKGGTAENNLTIESTKNITLTIGGDKENDINATSAGKTSITTGNGDDTIISGGAANSTIISGKGDDNITIASTGNNEISAGIGQDNINITEATGVNTIKVDGSNDITDVNDTKTVVTVVGFRKDNDFVKIDGLPAGEDGTNYIAGTKSEETVEEALEQANGGLLSGDLKYAKIVVKDKDSYLAFDINGDHKVDGAIYLKDTNLTVNNIK